MLYFTAGPVTMPFKQETYGKPVLPHPEWLPLSRRRILHDAISSPLDGLGLVVNSLKLSIMALLLGLRDSNLTAEVLGFTTRAFDRQYKTIDCF
jgi:hypothetical protein